MQVSAATALNGGSVRKARGSCTLGLSTPRCPPSLHMALKTHILTAAQSVVQGPCASAQPFSDLHAGTPYTCETEILRRCISNMLPGEVQAAHHTLPSGPQTGTSGSRSRDQLGAWTLPTWGTGNGPERSNTSMESYNW